MSLKGRHFLTTQDFTREELEGVLDLATQMKRGGGPVQPLLGKSIALLFFNPSLRTRSSFELGMFQLGGHAVVLAPGRDAWSMEAREGGVMDGEPEEHVKESARVLSRFFDALAVRCFPKFQDWSVDREDPMLSAIVKHATKPVINLETIVHPCQELALMQTIREHLGEPRKKKFLLTWTWHPKGLNTAVANSAVLISTKFGMDVTLLRPEGYDLDPRYLEAAASNATANGGSFRATSNIEEAYRGADFVYAKSWGAIPYFGRWEEEKQVRASLKHYIVDSAKMKLTNNAKFSHCLPMRRNIKVTDEVADSPAAAFIDEAENRLHVQKALLAKILGGVA